MAWCTQVTHLSRVAVRFHGVLWRLMPHRHHMSVTPTPVFKAVIFDMYGVLIPSPIPKATEWEENHGVPLGTIGQAIRTGGDGNAWKKYMRGELGTEEFVAAFSQDCSKIAGSKVHVGSFLLALTSGSMTRPCPVMLDAIQCARAEGLKTAVLSNNFLLPGGESYLPLERSLFDVIVESCREGMCKPDPRIYRLCADRLGVSPHEAVFLDDLGFNVKAAAQVGMHGITVGDPTVAVKELEGVLQFPLSGFVPGTRSVRKGEQLPMDRLTQYLSKAIQLPDTDPVTARQFSQSCSDAAFLLSSRGRRLVLKKKPQGQTVARECRVLKALRAAGVPVPEVIAHCDDPSILVSPFHLTEYCPGRVFQDPSLPGLEPEERRVVYEAMTQTLCQVHSLDLRATGLEHYGEPGLVSVGELMEEQVRRWTQRYQASESQPIPAMQRLMDWLPLHLPKQQTATQVHGNFRLNNLVFDPEKPEVRAILDWGLSALGDPLMDLASSCLAHYLPPDSPILPGLGQGDPAQLGIPTAEEMFEQYSRSMGLDGIPNWQFYMAFSFFRLAAILQEEQRSAVAGQTSSPSMESSRHLTEQVAELAWDFAIKEGFRIFNAMPRVADHRGRGTGT